MEASSYKFIIQSPNLNCPTMPVFLCHLHGIIHNILFQSKICMFWMIIVNQTADCDYIDLPIISWLNWSS